MKRFESCWIVILALALPAGALADITDQSNTLQVGQTINMDTGAVATSGGDLKWDGTQLTALGSARAVYVGPGDFEGTTKTQIQQFLSISFPNIGIPASGLSGNSIVAVLTNGGNYAKLQFTGNNNVTGKPLAILFTTYGASGGGSGPSAPTISAVQNNSSSVPNGFPNSGVAPSTLIKIVGNGLAAAGDATLHSSEGSGLQATLNGASITVNVGGATLHPAMYYATPTQIDAVLPASTPVGSGTLTVSYNGATSNPATIQVVPSSLGIDVYSGSFGVATDNSTGAVLTPTNSGRPGETVVLWGTGLGADPADSDTTYTTSPHAVSTPIQAWLGGVPLNILYSGATVYPGVSVIIFTIPASAPSGCFVPFAALTGSGANLTVSNNAVFPIMPNGGVCTDTLTGITGTNIGTLSGQTTVKSGSLFVIETTAPGVSGPPSTSGLAAASFQSVTSSSYNATSGSVSIGGCTLLQNLSAGGSSSSTGLDAGSISLTEPSGNSVTLSTVPILAGFYEAELGASDIPSAGGAFKFTGSGGKDVGPFSATLSFPNPLISWTNQGDSASVTRSASQLVTWTGGAPGSYVIIGGTSTNGGVTGSYTCIAPQSALQFTVPNYILLGLPAGTGTTSVENSTTFSTFSAPGLDFGALFGAVSVQVNTTYK